MDFGPFKIPKEHIIVKTKHCFVFTNLRPFLPYHILVSPKAVKPFISDLSLEEYHDLFDCVRLSLKSLEKYGNSFTVSCQDGKDAGQSVPHVHVHILPRNKNDIEDNDRIYSKGALDIIRSDRSFEEMASEALQLRKDFSLYFDTLDEE